jgi:hypothetical protein
MSFEGQHDSLLKNHSDAGQEIEIIHTTLIKNKAACTDIPHKQI